MSTIIWGTKSGPAGVRAQCCNCRVRLVNGDNLMGESTLSNGMLAVTALKILQRLFNYIVRRERGTNVAADKCARFAQSLNGTQTLYTIKQIESSQGLLIALRR